MPDLVVDLLKHLTTLNAAVLVLFLAILQSFPSGGSSSILPTWTLGLFGFSMIVATVGLYGAVLHKGNFPSDAFAYLVLLPFILAWAAFLAALLLAVFTGIRTL